MKLQQPKKLARELVASNNALSKYTVLKILTMLENLEKGEKVSAESLKKYLWNR